MRVVCLVALLCAAGCTVNVPELTAAQATLDLQLAERKAIADNLSDFRQGLDAESDRLAEAMEKLSPSQRAAVEAVKGSPPPPRPSYGPVPIPPASPLEGSDAARLRRNIADTEQRIAELDKVLTELQKIKIRRAEVLARLAVVEQLKGGMVPPQAKP